MPIIFSAVACDKKIEANFASCDGNFTEIAEQVLSKIPTRDHKMTYAHGPYLFHYIIEDTYFYFCITDKMCQRSRAFLFLNEIQRKFDTDSKENFREVLAKEMHRYSEDYSTITIRKGELDELNSIGVDSSERILGEKILYVHNPDSISYSEGKQADGLRDGKWSPPPLDICNTSGIDNTTGVANALSALKEEERTVTYVGKTPERISISVGVPNTKLYIIYLGICILIIGSSVFIFGPVSSLVFLLITACYCARSVQSKNKKD